MEICNITLVNISICKIIGYPVASILGILLIFLLAGFLFKILEPINKLVFRQNWFWGQKNDHVVLVVFAVIFFALIIGILYFSEKI